MTAQTRARKIGWIAALAFCTVLYLLLHLSVRAVKSDVIRSERQIVRLQQEQVLLETEFETRANLLQL
jgi:ABC-type anion transport system duplicated permease subunit